jgi:hypothetical protein
MLLQAKLKCNKDHVPYRVYVDDELITERFYTIASKDTVCNDVKVESLSDTPVHLVDYTIRKIPNENT